MYYRRPNFHFALFVKSLLGVLCASAAMLLPAVYAENLEPETGRWWQVEIIIFSFTGDAGLQQESWPTSRMPIDLVNLPLLNQQLTLARTEDTHAADAATPAVNLTANNAADADNRVETELSPEAETALSDYPAEIANDSGGANELNTSGGFAATPPDQWRLSKQASEMRWSKKYQVLFHQSWRHQFEAEGKPLRYAIVAGRELTGQGPNIGRDGLLPELLLQQAQQAQRQGEEVVANSKSVQQFNALNTNSKSADDIRLQAQSAPVFLKGRHYELEGTLQFDLRRYLHLETNLWLTVSDQSMPNANTVSPDSGTREPAYVYGHLQQARRLRSGEIHYLDHPLLGVIVRITPWRTPTEP